MDEDITVLKNVPMSKYTTFRIGGNADIIAFPENPEQLRYLLTKAKNENIPVTILGRGSNILVKDGGLEGLVICTIHMKNICIAGEHVICLAGSMLSEISKEASKNGLGGMEGLSGIPGTVGGAVVMNAGAYGYELSDILLRVDTVDKNGVIKRYSKDELDLGYRHSIFSDSNNDEVIFEIELELKKSDPEAVALKMHELNEKRRLSQPLELPSAGSAFKRPEGYFAAALIDQAGLKGLRVGDAQVSEKHAGFIVNLGKARSKDVLTLISEIKGIIYEKYNVMLEEEIKIIGKE